MPWDKLSGDPTRQRLAMPHVALQEPWRSAFGEHWQVVGMIPPPGGLRPGRNGPLSRWHTIGSGPRPADILHRLSRRPAVHQVVG